MNRLRYFYNEEECSIIKIEEKDDTITLLEYNHVIDVEVEEEPEEVIEEKPKKKKVPVKSGHETKKSGHKVDDDRGAIIKDIGLGMKAKDIADKHNIVIQAVYNIKSDAKKNGLLNSRSQPTVSTRQKEELTVLTPRTREAIKDLRDRDMTSTEIAEELDLDVNDVMKVMSRHSKERVTNQEGLNAE